MAGEDDLSMRATLDDAVSTVLERIEQRLDGLERHLDEVGPAGETAGKKIEDGAKKSEDALGKTERQADKTKASVKGLGDEVTRTGKKTDDATSRWDRYQKKLADTAKKHDGFARVLKLIKFNVMVGGAYAGGAALSALGAGAITALSGVGHLALGMSAAVPVFAAAKLGMLAFNLGMKAAGPQADALKKQFDSIGKSVLSGGLGAGLMFVSKNIGPFLSALNDGFSNLGGSLGGGAVDMTRFLTSAGRVAQTRTLFDGFGTILDHLIATVIHLAGGFMNLLQAALPAGIELSGVIEKLSGSFEKWSEAQLTSGNAQRSITNGLHTLFGVVQTVTNFLVGLFNIFKIGSQYAGTMGQSIGDLSEKFRAWTTSAAGVNSINDYFLKAQPTIHETMLLLGDLFKLFGGLSNSANAAPLIAQFRTELLPVIAELVAKFTGDGGLLSSIITAATALGKLALAIDPATFDSIITGFTTIITSLQWIVENVPGAGSALSAMVTAWAAIGAVSAVGEKVTGVIDTISGLGGTWTTVAEGASSAMDKMSDWNDTIDELTGYKDQVKGALDWTKSLVAEGGFLAGPWGKAKAAAGTFFTFLKTTAISSMAMVRTGALLMWDALMGPVGLVILAIIAIVAVIIYLWNNCEWFRDAVTAVWEWIQMAAIACWNWIVNAVTVAIQVITAIAMWLWTNVFQPIWNGIAAAAAVAWAIISFIVQTAVFIIVGIIVVLATILEFIWFVVSTAAVWAWQNVILPVVMFVVNMIITIVTFLVTVAVAIWTAISTAAVWCWQVIILPMIMAVVAIIMAIWTPIAEFFTMLWNGISTGAGIAWQGVIQPVITAVAGVVMAIWSPIAAFFSVIWSAISTAAGAAFNFIGEVASNVAGAVSGAWNAVIGVVKGVYNAIAGAWNSIPSITVPDWIPGIGGQNFSLPKLPTLWHGGRIEYDAAIVGEHGPEPLIGSAGQLMGMLGTNGPEVATGLPRGGYVVPNLDTLSAMPGLVKKLPAGVAGAVSRSVPGYAAALGGGRTTTPPPPRAASGEDGTARAIASALAAVAAAVAERPPPISASSGDVEAEVYAALRKWDQQRELRSRYSYGGAG